MKVSTWINIILFLLSPILGGCAQFLERRSFIDEMNQEDSFFMAGRDFRTVPGDSGQMHRSRRDLMERTPASFRSKEEFETQRSLQQELEKREAGLSEHDRLVYQQAKSVLQTDSERIYYLNLPVSERSHYLQTRMAEAGPYANSERSRRPLSLMEQREVAPPRLQVGMDKDMVVQKMGRPSRVDVAGNPSYENERWAYTVNGSVSYVYFESGQVHGWTFP